MPDYTVLDISYINREYLLSLTCLEFKELVSRTTGEAGHKKVAIFYGLRIIVYRTRASIKGSFHQAYNQLVSGRCHNCNDFNYAKFRYVVDFLQKIISLDPAQTKLSTMEYGVTIDVSASATQILQENFFNHKFIHGPEEDKNYAKKGKCKRFATAHYQIKSYDKARQCGLEGNMIRIELRTLKAQYTQRLGINTLQDLLDPQNLSKLASDLLKRFNEIIILDQFCLEATADYWIGLQTTTKPRTLRRRKVDFMKRMEKEDQFKIKRELLTNIKYKLEWLIYEDVAFLPLDKG